jgi:hypothetical protein
LPKNTKAPIALHVREADEDVDVQAFAAAYARALVASQEPQPQEGHRAGGDEQAA